MNQPVFSSRSAFVFGSVFSALAALGCGEAPEGAFDLPGTHANPFEVIEQELASRRNLELTPLGSFATGLFDQAGAEIAAHDPSTGRLFSVSSAQGMVNVLDIADPTLPVLVTSIPTAGDPNSVAVRDGVLAVVSTAPSRTDPGFLQLFDAASGSLLRTLTVGAVPDMVTFTPNGCFLLVANEGEPSDDYTVDPEGSVSVVDLRGGIASVTQAAVRTARFTDVVPLIYRKSIRVFGPGATVAQDLEPEYIVVSDDSRTAWVTLQENNAVAVLDIRNARFDKVIGLGFKNHSKPRNALDASDRDGAINIQSWPVMGLYLPDAITAYKTRGRTFLVTANEGDARDYDGFAEEERVKDLVLDPVAFPNAADLRQDAQIGRLTVTKTLGDADGDGDYDQLFSLGGRSISIWTTDGAQVWDSGSELETITAMAHPADFNSDNAENDSFDNRSDNKGPEPEGVTVARLFGRHYAFVALERIGGVAVYEVTFPERPRFVTYVNLRDFTAEDPAAAGDLGPEGLLVIEADESPNGRPLLVVSNEVSGNTRLFEIAPSP